MTHPTPHLGSESGVTLIEMMSAMPILLTGMLSIAGLLGTTSRFLEVFGLEELSDMPSLKEFENLDDSQLPTILREKMEEEFPIEEEPEALDQTEGQTATDEELLQAAEAGAEEFGEAVPQDLLADDECAGGGETAGGPEAPEEDEPR